MYNVLVCAERQAKADAFLDYITANLFRIVKPVSGRNSTLVLQVDAWLGDKVPDTENVLDDLIASDTKQAVQFVRQMCFSMSQEDLTRGMARLTNELEQELKCEVTTNRVAFMRYGMCTQVEFISEALDTAVYLTFSLDN